MNLNTLPHGDMPGDKIQIEQSHIDKAETIYPVLRSLLPDRKAVVCVCGGSGVGKSEIASLLAGLLREDGIKAYVMSGDNYPHRIPAENDAERERVFAAGGREALDAYLGSPKEIDFGLVNTILADFKAGKDFLEWTHGNSDYLRGVDIPILLNSTPEETLAHRRARARDKGVDSPFTTLVLELEQAKLVRQAHKAKIIVSKAGELISYADFCVLMGVQA